MTPIVSVSGLTKRYGGVVALDGLNLDVASGAIHAVVGENGAGKSTLMKVLAGVVKPDAGAILFDGTRVAIDSPAAARRRGVGMVYQELSLFPERSVLANLFVNREPLRHGLISTRAMEDRSRELLDRLGLDVDVNAPVGRLSIGEQQLVELARVLLEGPRLLILDEPNSALNQRETDRLFAVLRQLSERGVTMLYVSHRLEEVFAISDRVTVARNGKDVMTRGRAGLAMSEVIEAMIGAHREDLFPPRATPSRAAPANEIRVNEVSGGELEDVSFAARSGEIVGLAGLEGAGVATLLAVLFGAKKAQSGEAVFPDARGLPLSPTEAARRGVCLVPADRKRNGLMLDRSILLNISQVVFGAVDNRFFPLFSRAEASARAHRQIERLHIRTQSPETLVNHLSGGNQQKVLIGKWLEIEPRVVLLDDPTRGVDIGAKREIYELIRQMSADGRIVIFSSTELPELIGLCDRILVLYRGRLVDELSGDAIDNHTLLHLINTGERPPARTSAVQ
jgi:ABC-type sugar transport system ATPase subunit